MKELVVTQIPYENELYNLPQLYNLPLSGRLSRKFIIDSSNRPYNLWYKYYSTTCGYFKNSFNPRVLLFQILKSLVNQFDVVDFPLWQSADC